MPIVNQTTAIGETESDAKQDVQFECYVKFTITTATTA